MSAARRGQQRVLPQTSLFCGVYAQYGADTAYYIQAVSRIYQVTELFNTLSLFCSSAVQNQLPNAL